MHHSKATSGIFWGGILILLGALLLLDNFYYLDFGDIISTYWPLILVVIGIKMIYDRGRYRVEGEESFESFASSAEEGGKSSKDGLSESNVFGDIQLQAASENFRGGSVSNVFGDIKLDLSEIKLARGITKVFINGVFGDVTIIAPKGIPFKARTNSVAGDIMVRSNKKEGLFTKLEHTEGDYDKAAEKLYIQCSIVFGSINIY
jgi:predicted membrane protein